MLTITYMAFEKVLSSSEKLYSVKRHPGGTPYLQGISLKNSSQSQIDKEFYHDINCLQSHRNKQRLSDLLKCHTGSVVVKLEKSLWPQILLTELAFPIRLHFLLTSSSSYSSNKQTTINYGQIFFEKSTYNV